jgi:hypothetical protein
MKTQVLALLVVSALSPVAAVAQQPTAAAAPAATRAGTLRIPQPAAGFVQPMTPWGEPDLQGFWPGVEMVGVPLQRPARFGTRNVLTEEEFEQRARDITAEEDSLLAEIDVFTADVTTPCAIRCPTSGTWTRPWTLSLPWMREPVYGMFEYACHEGNYAMRNILSASRVAEANGSK